MKKKRPSGESESPYPDQRKRAEDELKYNSAIIAEANDAIITTKSDEDFTITNWNPGAEKIYGWKKKEVLGRSSMFLQNEYPGQDPKEILEKILEAGLYEGEVLQSRKDGTRVFVDARLIARKDNNGDITDWICINRDITERKRAEEEKRCLEERSRKIVEDIFRFIPEGVLVFSRKMELLRQNQAFRELVSGYAGRLGFAEDELENLIIDKIKAGMVDKNIKEIRISRKHETGKQT